MEERAKSVGRTFVAVGISKDAGTSDGLDHLKEISESFDEVNTGRGWLNHGLLHFLFVRHLGQAATPQIVMLKRSIVRDATTGYAVTEEEVVLRKVGLQEIANWDASGAPLPMLAASSPAP